MKTRKISTLLLVFSIVLINRIYAQNDYVITKKNDTIFCKVRAHGFTTSVLQYKANGTDKYTVLDTNNIREYFIAQDSSNYVFKTDRKYHIEGWVNWFERGRINLYEAILPAGQNNEIIFYYASKGNDDFVLINAPRALISAVKYGSQKEREKAFLDIFSDDFTLWEKFKNARKGDHRNEFILASVEEYNKVYSSIDTNIWDYVITNKNDTVKCRLRYNNVLNDYLYKIKGKSDYITIDNADIKEYFFSRENITFKPLTFPGQNKVAFVKWLERGQINLYEWTTLTGDADDRTIKYYWYISKGNGPLFPIKVDADYIYDLRAHKEQLAAFKNIIADDKNVLAEFNDNFRHAETNTDMAIRYYIKNYNDAYLNSHKAAR